MGALQLTASARAPPRAGRTCGERTVRDPRRLYSSAPALLPELHKHEPARRRCLSIVGGGGGVRGGGQQQQQGQPARLAQGPGLCCAQRSPARSVPCPRLPEFEQRVVRAEGNSRLPQR